MRILGITTSHEAGASLIEDGRVVAAISEERLNRQKCYAGLPVKSLEWILSCSGNNPVFDGIAIAGLIHREVPPTNSDLSTGNESDLDMTAAELFVQSGVGSLIMKSAASVKIYRELFRRLPQRSLEALKALLASLDIQGPITLCDHHTAHLASAYYTSGFDEALVISNDGFGDGYCSKVAIGKAGVLKEIDANPFINSLGMYYLYSTHLCGFPKYYHAGKTMGLAAHGNAEKSRVFFKDSLSFNEKTGRYLNQGQIFRKEIERMRNGLKNLPREDIAAGIQEHTELLLMQQASHFMKKTGLKQIALAGGVHANVRANQKISELEGLEKIFVHPNMGDGGLAAGSGLWLYAQMNLDNQFRIPPQMTHAYLGPKFSDEQIEKTLAQYNLKFSRPSDLNSQLAMLLSQGKIIARFQGAMEYGPRALGNRSILYQATDRTANDWLNKQLNRTEFMPFAPVIRDQDASLFFKNVSEKNMNAARFMTITYDVTEKCRREAPAVVHIDGTARPQIISRTDNPDYYDLLSVYQKLTGLAVLVNTSFNMHEEPIVCSPEDAVRAFQASSLDALALNSYLIFKDVCK